MDNIFGRLHHMVARRGWRQHGFVDVWRCVKLWQRRRIHVSYHISWVIRTTTYDPCGKSHVSGSYTPPKASDFYRGTFWTFFDFTVACKMKNSIMVDPPPYPTAAHILLSFCSSVHLLWCHQINNPGTLSLTRRQFWRKWKIHGRIWVQCSNSLHNFWHFTLFFVYGKNQCLLLHRSSVWTRKRIIQVHQVFSRSIKMTF